MSLMSNAQYNFPVCFAGEVRMYEQLIFVRAPVPKKDKNKPGSIHRKEQLTFTACTLPGTSSRGRLW